MNFKIEKKECEFNTILTNEILKLDKQKLLVLLDNNIDINNFINSILLKVLKDLSIEPLVFIDTVNLEVLKSSINKYEVANKSFIVIINNINDLSSTRDILKDNCLVSFKIFDKKINNTKKFDKVIKIRGKNNG